MPDFDPRRASPGQEFGFTDRAGRQHTLRADDDGVVHPKTAHEAALLDGFDLPVARKAIAEAKALEPPKPASTKSPVSPADDDGGQD